MKILALLLCVAIPVSALGCPAMTKPREDKLDAYKAIFEGEVLGTELTEYENSLKRCQKDNKTQCAVEYSDVEPYEVTVNIQRVFKGAVSGITTLKIAACGSYPPRMHDEGIFFVDGDGYVVPLYPEEHDYYYYWFYKLNGLKNPDNY